MKADPVIDAIREVRHHISKSVNHDAQKLVAYYQKLQERHRDRISKPPAVTSPFDVPCITTRSTISDILEARKESRER
jgi:hypothetical protein